jgi:transposase
LELFGQSLDARDCVALEVTGNAWEIARILEPHVARVIVVSPSDTGIRQARAKTDRLDARALAKLLWTGQLAGVWTPDERIRAMRRRLARRAQLLRARSRAKNEIHAVLMRCLKDRPPASDLFGVKGRRWLAEQQLSLTERETVDSAVRQVDFLDAEIAAVEQLIAAEALSWPEIKRLMTVPGVNVIVAATFMAAVGDIRRFPDRRKLTAYLGLDPRVRQSGAGPATHGHISKQGSSPARHALVEACWTTVRQPGPIAGFYQRVKARRGHSIAIVASARKLACLFWCLLSRGEDYAFAQPSLTKKKMRRLEPQAGAARYQAAAESGRPTTRCARPNASSHCRPNAPTNARSTTARRARWVRARHRAAHLMARQASTSRGRPQALSLRFDSSSPAPTSSLPPPELTQQLHLTFIRRPLRQSEPSISAKPLDAGFMIRRCGWGQIAHDRAAMIMRASQGKCVARRGTLETVRRRAVRPVSSV